MTHHHNHTTGNLKISFFLNLGFTLVELVGGFLTNSMAILSDALHDLGDSVALGTSWYLEKVAKRSRDRSFSFGYKRFSLLGAIINSIVLVVGSILILTKAIPRLWQPESPNAEGMFGLAILGVIVNGLAVIRLRKGSSINEQVVSWHLLEDVLGWIAVLIVSVVLMFWELPILDPLLSIMITLFVLYNVIKSLRKSWTIVLQGVPEEVYVQSIENTILAYQEVQSVHDLHVWTLDGEYHILTAHVVVNNKVSAQNLVSLKCRLKEALNSEHINHVTLEMELENEDCGQEEAV